MNIRNLNTLLCIGLLLLTPEIVFAASEETPPEPLAQCARLVHEAFGDNQEEETAKKLFSAANHPFCKGTKLEKITRQRWLMSPVKIGGVGESAPSFLGPKLVDKECLDKFDTFFVSSLVKGSELESQLAGMEEKLMGCTKELSPEYTRP